MMITQTLVAIVVGIAFVGGIAASADSALEDQTATAQSASAPSAGTETTVVEKVDDGMLTVQVKAALIDSPATKAHQINVETQEGVVRLIGAVDSATAKSAATTVAKSVKGVKEVKNELTISPN